MKVELWGGPLDGHEREVQGGAAEDIYILRLLWSRDGHRDQKHESFYQRRDGWNPTGEPIVFDYIGEQLPPGETWRRIWHEG